MPTVSESNTAPECMCGILPREDRDDCPEHGTKTQPVHAPRRVSVGRTQPLYDVSSYSSALAKIENIVNRAMMNGEFNNSQIGIMMWAIRKCRTKLRTILVTMVSRNCELNSKTHLAGMEPILGTRCVCAMVISA
jgi:hypothetical protein